MTRTGSGKVKNNPIMAIPPISPNHKAKAKQIFAPVRHKLLGAFADRGAFLALRTAGFLDIFEQYISCLIQHLCQVWAATMIRVIAFHQFLMGGTNLSLAGLLANA